MRANAAAILGMVGKVVPPQVSLLRRSRECRLYWTKRAPDALNDCMWWCVARAGRRRRVCVRVCDCVCMRRGKWVGAGCAAPRSFTVLPMHRATLQGA